MINYYFDVDGTLTPSRKKIEPTFEFFFAEWVQYQQSMGNKIFLITGSDKCKTIEQIGVPMYRLVDGVYQNSGNQLFERNNIKYERHWEIPAGLLEELDSIAKKSIWYGRAGNNIEKRIGQLSELPMMINFSTVGRDASSLLRKEYFDWDKEKEERLKIVEQLSDKYKDVSFSIGGEISIDILPKGRDKSQALKDAKGKTVFFGDKCDLGGNDFEIATMSDMCYHVKGWIETNEILARLLPKNN